MHSNVRGMLLMVLAMASFATWDMLVKLTGRSLPGGEIMIGVGLFGVIAFAVLHKRRGGDIWSRDFFHPAVLIRNLCEIWSTAGLTVALILLPMTLVTALLQSLPLAVTAGAAIFLREPVGWRRWSAILVGLVGVLIMIGPGALQDDAPVLGIFFVLLAVLGMTGRDLAGRRTPDHVRSSYLAMTGSVAMVLIGIPMALWDGQIDLPDTEGAIYLALAAVIGTIGYFAITESVRVGEISIVAPVRYSRLIFGVTWGVLVFQDELTWPIIIGSIIVVASGLYTALREAVQPKATPALGAAAPWSVNANSRVYISSAPAMKPPSEITSIGS